MAIVQVRAVDHIVLNSKNPENSVKFYERVFGFRPVRLDEYRRGKVPFPSVRVTDSFLIDFYPLQTVATPGSKIVTNLNSFAVRLDDNTDLDRLIEQLAAGGVRAERQVDGLVVTRFGALGQGSSIYVRDPDNNIVELKTHERSCVDREGLTTRTESAGHGDWEY